MVEIAFEEVRGGGGGRIAVFLEETEISPVT